MYTVEYYSVIKKKEILSFITKWIQLETNILSKICIFKILLERQSYTKES